jgi:arsenate reductase-like glutaredoxin family protein
MKSNTMRVNGKEEEWTDAQMRDWYEDHCDSLTQVLCNRNSTLRKLSKEYRDLQQAYANEMLKTAELQQAYTNEMLWNGELSEELKKVNDEEK